MTCKTAVWLNAGLPFCYRKFLRISYSIKSPPGDRTAGTRETSFLWEVYRLRDPPQAEKFTSELLFQKNPHIAGRIFVILNERRFLRAWNGLSIWKNAFSAWLVKAFGTFWGTWQVAPVLYLLLTALFAALGGALHCRCQVSGR